MNSSQIIGLKYLEKKPMAAAEAKKDILKEQMNEWPRGSLCDFFCYYFTYRMAHCLLSL